VRHVVLSGHGDRGDWRLPEVQARYEGFFVEYVADKIRRAAVD